MKRILTLTLVLLLTFSSFCFAAVSSSKPKAAPKPSTSAPSVQQTKPADTTSGYKPSAPASSYSEKAPAVQSKPGTQPNSQQPTSGGFWRNVGVFGGGMLLGGLLSSMFGFGNMGWLSSMLGILINIMMVVGIFMGIRYLWDRFKRKKQDDKPKHY